MHTETRSSKHSLAMANCKYVNFPWFFDTYSSIRLHSSLKPLGRSWKAIARPQFPSRRFAHNWSSKSCTVHWIDLWVKSLELLYNWARFRINARPPGQSTTKTNLPSGWRTSQFENSVQTRSEVEKDSAGGETTRNSSNLAGLAYLR